MNANLNIRVATEDDTAALYALYRQLESPRSEVSPERITSILNRAAAYPDYHVYVAVAGERVIGTFALLIFEALGDRCRPVGVVEDVVVDLASRSRGVGKEMMDFALARCAARGCYKMMLSSNETREAAHRFYESLGFERHGFSFLVRLEGDR